MKRSASAVWKGGLQDGRGTVSTDSGVLSNVPYTFKMRFENEKGTNPEEFVAAAHAACFSMALSLFLGQAGMTAESIQTKATVTLDQVEGGFAVTSSHLLGAPPRVYSRGSCRRPCERANNRMRELGEIAIVHPDRVCVRARVERHFDLTHQASIDEHALEIQTAERGHRARFAVGIQAGEFLLARETNDARARQGTQPFEVDDQVGREHNQNRLVVEEADDDLRP